MSREKLELHDRVRYEAPGYPPGSITAIIHDQLTTVPYEVTWDDGVVSRHEAKNLHFMRSGTPDDTWQPPEFPEVLRAEVEAEMLAAREKGWTVEHDRAEGSGHLTKEVGFRLSHMGEYPTDAFVRHQLVVCIGLLANAVKTLDWATSEDGHTVVVDSSDPQTEPEQLAAEADPAFPQIEDGH